MKQFYPFLLTDFPITGPAGPGGSPGKYYDFNSTLDPLDLAAHSVSTVPGSPHLGGDDGGCGDCDDEVERVLPPVSATSGLDFGAVKMITPTVTLRKTPSE